MDLHAAQMPPPYRQGTAYGKAMQSQTSQPSAYSGGYTGRGIAGEYDMEKALLDQDVPLEARVVGAAPTAALDERYKHDDEMSVSARTAAASLSAFGSRGTVAERTASSAPTGGWAPRHRQRKRDSGITQTSGSSDDRHALREPARAMSIGGSDMRSDTIRELPSSASSSTDLREMPRRDSAQTQAELQLSPLYAATAALPTAATPPAAYAASASDATATPRRPPAAGSTDLYDLLVSLPFELRRQIYDETGPLTEMLHGELVQPVARSRFTRIVAECFLFNRVDVARGLPRVPLGCETLLVHSREMRMLLHEFPRSPYERLYTAFDLGTDSMLDPAVLDAASELFATIADADTAAMAGDLLDFVASRLLEWAAALGRLGTVKELLWHADEPSSRTFYLAGKHGHLPVIRFLCDGGYDKHVSPNGAVEGGKLGVLAWLRTRYSRQAPSALSILRALRSKAPDAARGVWILLADPTLRHSDVFTHIQDICAEAGSVEMLLFARENGIGDGLSAGAIDRAAFHGHLAMVQFLHTSTDATCSTSAMDGAAANGHLAVVEFLHAQRTEGCTHRAATSAAANGHQQILEWMIANRRRDCRIDDIVAQACDSGQYAILLWIWNNLPEDRAAFTINAAKLATRHGHFAIVDFYSQKQSAGPGYDSGAGTDLNMLLRVAIEGGHVFLAEWLHDHAHMIRFLVETCGIAPTEAAIFSAASAGSLETVEYLFERFPSMNWAGARQEALRENNQRNAYWIGLKLDIRSVALSLSNVP
nr:hypothetical protein HK105_001206 [Polyrhizophydium stewartii]